MTKKQPRLSKVPRLCVNANCRQEYLPSSNAQKWCSDCLELGDRDRILNRNHTNSAKGRICVWCLRDDSVIGFHRQDRCMTCTNRGYKNGVCSVCEAPLRKLGNNTGVLFCEECHPVEPQEGYLRVTLMWEGETKTVYKSPGCKLNDPSAGGRPRNLKWLAHENVNGGEFVLLVSQADFVAGRSKNPIAVKGLSDWPPWIESVGTISSKLYEDLVDMLHFLRLEDANPVRSIWWAGKFRSDASREATARSWERFKVRFRALGIAHTPRRLSDLDGASGDAQEVALEIDVADLARFVEMAIRVRERREALRPVRQRIATRRREAAKARKIAEYLGQKSDPAATLPAGEETLPRPSPRGAHEELDSQDVGEG